MAYRKYVTTIPIWKNVAGTGGTYTSDQIDLSEVNRQGAFTLTYEVGASGLAATAATTNFKYVVCDKSSGNYRAPTNGDKGTIGTAGSGASGSQGALSFSPVTAAFMKILAVLGTNGTSRITAELNVR